MCTKLLREISGGTKVEADSGRQKAESDIVAIVKDGEESPIGQLKKLGQMVR